MKTRSDHGREIKQQLPLPICAFSIGYVSFLMDVLALRIKRANMATIINEYAKHTYIKKIPTPHIQKKKKEDVAVLPLPVDCIVRVRTNG